MSHHRHAFTALNPLIREGLELSSRRNFLKASVAGVAGLSLPALLRHRAEAGASKRKNKSVPDSELLGPTGPRSAKSRSAIAHGR